MSADGPGQNRLSAAHRSLSLLFFTRHPGDNPSTQPATRGRHTPPGRRPQSTAPHEGGTHASRETTPAHSPLGGCTEVGTELEKTLVVFRLSPEFEELYKATQAHT